MSFDLEIVWLELKTTNTFCLYFAKCYFHKLQQLEIVILNLLASYLSAILPKKTHSDAK